MKYLLGTARGMYLVTEDTIQRVYRRWIYGITWNEQRVFGIGNKIVYLFDPKTLRRLECKKVKQLIDPHQAHLCSPWHLYVTNTGLNRVEVWDTRRANFTSVDWNEWNAQNKHCECHRPERLKEIPDDINHINSIWFDGACFWVTEHNLGPSRVKQMSSDFEVLNSYRVGCQIHNIYVEDKRYLYTCDSANDRVVRFDLKQRRVVGSVECKKKNTGFPRGLAKSKDRFLVGLSYRVGRNYRNKRADTYVLTLDVDLKILEARRIPEVSQIFEIRLLDEADYAHNQIILGTG